MAHVVHFKIVDIPLPHGAPALLFADDLLGGKVAVLLLGPGKERGVILQLIQQLFIPGFHRRVCRRLEPLVIIPVAEHGAVKVPFRFPGGDAEVFHHVADVLFLEHALQMGHGDGGHGIEPFLVQAACPVHVLIGDGGQSGIGGMGGIGDHAINPFACSAFFSSFAPNRGLDRVGLPTAFSMSFST